MDLTTDEVSIHAKQICSDFGVPFRAIENKLKNFKNKEELSFHLRENRLTYKLDKTIARSDDMNKILFFVNNIADYRRSVLVDEIKRNLNDRNNNDVSKDLSAALKALDGVDSFGNVLRRIFKMKRFEIDFKFTACKELSFKSISPIILKWKDDESGINKAVDLGYIGFSLSIELTHNESIRLYPAGDNVIVNKLFHPNIPSNGIIFPGSGCEKLSELIGNLDFVGIEDVIYKRITSFDKESSLCSFESFVEQRHSQSSKQEREVAVFLYISNSTDPRLSNIDVLNKLYNRNTEELCSDTAKKICVDEESVHIHKIGNFINVFEISYPIKNKHGETVNIKDVLGVSPSFYYTVDSSDGKHFDTKKLSESFAWYIDKELNGSITDFFSIIHPNFIWLDAYQCLYERYLIVETEDENGDCESSWRLNPIPALRRRNS